LKKKGIVCSKADDCATGLCVDGVCCDVACNGECEACDVKGSEGTCTPVVGPPHGAARASCDTLDPTDCGKTQCDGKARDKCNGFVNGGTTSCGVVSCTSDKRYQKTGACDGAGKCALPDPVPCNPYACDATAPSGCKATCANDDDCANDFRCEAGKCIQGAQCNEDRSQSTDKKGVTTDCRPYRCGSDGKCASSCATSDDCAAGTTCDPNAKACVLFSADSTDNSGGCGCATPGDSGRAPGSWLWFATLVGLGAARRRRARRVVSANDGDGA
jgi:MYXO-CTERM domain-containing protein